MKFISRLYFNLFKKIGNIRLLFVISCLFGGISLIIFITNITDNYVYFYKITTEDTFIEENYSKNPRLKPWDEARIEYYKAISPIIQKCKTGDAEQAYLEAEFFKFNNVGKDKELSTPELLCKRAQPRSEYIYSFSYLWNFWWVIFWFYLPFLIVLPIKFIIDGYKQDEKTTKK